MYPRCLLAEFFKNFLDAVFSFRVFPKIIKNITVALDRERKRNSDFFVVVCCSGIASISGVKVFN